MQRNQSNRLPALDGLRGFAAISVLIFHMGLWLNIPSLAPNSYLAVDLFFCLSGYVLPLAYQHRMDSLPTLLFLRIRLARLMPLIVLATAISASYMVFAFRKRFAGEGLLSAAAVISGLFGLFDLPYFGAPESIGGPFLFPLNPPQFTLFLELFVNTFWWVIRRMNQLCLSLVLATFCFLLLSQTGLGGDVPESFWSGFPRVGGSFFAGVAVFHLEDRVPHWRGWTTVFWLLAAVMAGLFYMPLEAPLGVQLVWVVVLSPFLVLTGARACLSAPTDRACMFGGAVSYPLYCLHYPIYRWINALCAHIQLQNIAIKAPLIITLALLGSFTILKLYDEPVRRLLTTRLQRLKSVR